MIINVKEVVVQGVKITVPTWVNWIAFDMGGLAWGYELKPVKSLNVGIWGESHEDQKWSQELFTAELTNNENWQDLLFNVGGE